jgi:hypothetical protein
MRLRYKFDPNVESLRPTTSPANYDQGEENPTGLWENDCSATERECSGLKYYGGYNQCAQGHSFWRVFKQERLHPQTDRVRVTGKIWTIDSWDNESFTVKMTDS